MRNAKTIDTLNEKAILELAKRDVGAYLKGNKSFELLNWLRDEMIIREVRKKTSFIVSARAFSKLVNLLALFREDNLSKLDVAIHDRSEVLISFEYDLTTLTGAQINILNAQYDLGLPEPALDDEDHTYDHMI